MREKELFRYNLDRLDEKFPNQEILKMEDLCKFLGISKTTCYRNWHRLYNKKIKGYSKTVIARELS